uniref:Uncharacterized protein n=1 Tax=Plectus sambesii TaxID=2011161 RepID=A0A914VQ91_9BILA
MDLDDSCNPSESEKDTLLTSIKKATIKELPSPLARRQDSEQSIQD